MYDSTLKNLFLSLFVASAFGLILLGADPAMSEITPEAGVDADEEEALEDDFDDDLDDELDDELDGESGSESSGERFKRRFK